MQSVMTRYTPPERAAFFRAIRAIRMMVASRASASKEEAPTTVSTSSTTLPIILEAADAPASMCEHSMVGESAGIVRKGQTASRWDVPCAGSGRARGQRCGAGACAPYWGSAMPASSRPAIFSLHAACSGTRESNAGRERGVRSAAAPHTCDDHEPLEFVTADAPPTTVSMVHFFGTAPLIDSSARWSRGAPRLRAEAFLVRPRWRGPAGV